MTKPHKHESPGWGSGAFEKHAENTHDFTAAGADGKDVGNESEGKCRMLKELQRRTARFGSGLYPLHGDNLLVSIPGGFSFVVPDLRAADRLLRQWEVTHEL